MAIVPILSPAEATAPAPAPAPEVASTADGITQQMGNVSITPMTPPRPVTGTTVRISVPLDATTRSAVYTERKIIRRDSIERREALLKGKEGSRQRRRWENARLLSNPWAEPPLPSDFEVRPTYPRRTVPYYLAPLWDAAEFQRAVEAKLKGRKNSTRSRGKRNTGMSPMEEAAISIPKEVRARLKRAKAAKGLLQDLEETVRAFVQKWNEREARLREDGLHDVPLLSDSEEDEEIVFIGRNGAMHDSPGKKQRQKNEELDETISSEKMVFEGLDNDKGAAFARWLVHCVGNYYGLRTWSVTRDVDGEEKRREAYVGVDHRARGFLGRGVELGREIELPRPLWGMV
ncbi:hypothetical protein LTR99_000407 [Exophiala xenobiotica]|uniref:R3H-associated N-terminal domain-containing protein n=1 Tax=Vermiconidia calcicola TaxID=1690605 RepID=A0AAV9QJ44_9PEZI|nr:hypothetical protein LTR92_003173 [Exophiala xenobiotica]KAK5543765.1 hypothetical protein LTR25_001380 [Vermiconidia calcicola]KAK5548443.1 hypothetical protein LTR23_001573 [Chaetothyriales sp. CCFEE 6169]KAK5213605.1 hypothetical protein LTR41_001185 [Exophiala xenobiotica]KAK5231279.1 hypothetical protein LTR72_000460 [Exophiala xenobiotica]